MNKLKKLFLIISALLLSTANNGFAGSASGSIAVTGAVVGTCTVSAAAMGLGTLNQNTTTVGTSLVTITCSEGVVWTVTNSESSNNLCVSSCASVANTIALPLTVASGVATHTAGTFVSGGSGNLTGTSLGAVQTGTITGTAAAASGKTAGNYTSTITLALAF